jgi:hypothetical protein
MCFIVTRSFSMLHRLSFTDSPEFKYGVKKKDQWGFFVAGGIQMMLSEASIATSIRKTKALWPFCRPRVSDAEEASGTTPHLKMEHVVAARLEGHDCLDVGVDIVEGTEARVVVWFARLWFKYQTVNCQNPILFQEIKPKELCLITHEDCGPFHCFKDVSSWFSNVHLTHMIASIWLAIGKNSMPKDWVVIQLKLRIWWFR